VPCKTTRAGGHQLLDFLQPDCLFLALGHLVLSSLPANDIVNGSFAIMADHAFDIQLPSMVRKPKAVWPGLERRGMYQKQIAGDGTSILSSSPSASCYLTFLRQLSLCIAL
jgi:hypothetical protein